MEMAAAHGIEVHYRPGGLSRASAFHRPEAYPAEFLMDAPAGKIFRSSGCHSDNSLCHDMATDGTKTHWGRAYMGLKAIIEMGFDDCLDRPNCDICDEPESGW